MERSERWVCKWRARFAAEGWTGLRGRSRRPHRLARQLPEAHRQAICQVRSELEAQAARGEGLKYIGAQAVRTRLKEQGLTPLPSTATIERVLRRAGMTHPRRRKNRQRPHPQLQERTPAEVHGSPRRRPTGLSLARKKCPLYEGKVHFIRKKVKDDGTISVLNVDWEVGQDWAGKGVWATLTLRTDGARLQVYDAAPDVPQRRLLASHPFPLSEPVLPRPRPGSAPTKPQAKPPRAAPQAHAPRNDVLMYDR